MPRALTVQNAEINTASITIRTLQVEGRQVTMGVFRQLPEHDIIDSDGPRLRGVGWGHVNYLIESSYLYSGRTIHLVWQLGNELRRCLVHQTLDVPRPRLPEAPYNAKPAYIERRRKDVLERPDSDYARAELKTCEEALDKWQAECDEINLNYEEDMDHAEVRNTLVAPLFDLPQLFIAA